MAPRLLVVMPVYNAGPYLRPALESILAQTYTDFRCLAIDDGSTDGSGQALRTYTDARLRVWAQPNRGPGAAMNRALDYARQEGIPYLARMDADDLSHPQRLEIQLALLEERPGAAACSANCIYIDADRGTAIGTSTVSAAPWLVRWEVLHGLRGLIQGACLFRSAALAEAGGYRPQFRRAEESDVFMRLAERFELANAREYLYQIRLRPDSLSMGDVHSNTLYQFYALDCSIRRRQGRPERDFAAFQADPGPGMRWRIWREERVLRLWRAGMGRGGTGRRLLAALLDPRRGVVRLLRRLDVG